MLVEGYGFMPNVVLFSKDLSDKQKLLYCLVSSLCAEKGFCWASNGYLWERLWVNVFTISRNVKALTDRWFLFSEIWEKNSRKLSLDPIAKNDNTYCEKTQPPYCEKTQYNNTIVNTTKEYKDIGWKTPFSPDSFAYKMSSFFIQSQSVNAQVHYLIEKKGIEQVIQENAKHVNDLTRLDWFNEEQISFIFKEVLADDFWVKQIMTPKKFREKDKIGVSYFVKMIDIAKDKRKIPKTQNTWITSC